MDSSYDSSTSKTSENESQNSRFNESSGPSSDNDGSQGPFTISSLPSKQYTFPQVDPYQYCSPIFFSFDKETYALMKNSIQNRTSITLQDLKSCDTRGILNLNRWRKMKESLCLEEKESGCYYLCLNLLPKLKIGAIEE